MPAIQRGVVYRRNIKVRGYDLTGKTARCIVLYSGGSQAVDLSRVSTPIAVNTSVSPQRIAIRLTDTETSALKQDRCSYKLEILDADGVCVKRPMQGFWDVDP